MGSDSINGGAGNDIVNVQLMTESYIKGEFSAYAATQNLNEDHDIYDGGTGNDTINFTDYSVSGSDTVGISIDLTNNSLHYDHASQTVTNFENVIGTAYNDTITGSSSDNVLDALGGDNTIKGGGGDDTIVWSKTYYGETKFIDSADEGNVIIQLKDVNTSQLTAYTNGTEFTVFVTAQTDGKTYSTVNNSAMLHITDNNTGNVFLQNPDGTLVDIRDIAQSTTDPLPVGGHAPQDGGIRGGDINGGENDIPPPPTIIRDISQALPSPVLPYAALVIDMDGNGIQVSSVDTHAIYFDVYGTGTKIATGWVDANDALLVIDRNSNGLIDNGNELFTTNAGHDGYTTLATLDSNSDGVINSSDTHFGDLKIWIDANQDGVSQLSELQTLTQAGIQSLSLSQSQTYIYSAKYGYELSSTSTATMSDTSTKTLGTGWTDVNFQNTLHPTPIPIDPVIRGLPQERGYGNLSDLDVQMSLDATLLSKVQAIHGMTEAQVLDPTQNFGGQFTDIMYLWDGNRGVNWENNSYYMDSRKYSFVQDISGTTTLTTYPGGSETYNFQTNGLWEKALTYYEGTFLAQTVFHDLFSNHSWFDMVKGVFTDVDALSGSGLSTLEGLIGSSSDAAYDWSLVVRAVEAWVGVDNLTSSDYSMLDHAIQVSTSYTLDNIHDMITGAPITITGTATGGETLTGTFVDDIINGGGGGDTLIGGQGDDTLYGSGYYNGSTYIGGSGDDIYYAVNTYGDDIYHFTSGHDLILDEMYGADKIVFDSGVTLSNISMELINTVDPSNADIYHGTNLVVHVEGAGDITVNYQYYSSADTVQGVETLQFSDSSTLDLVHLNDVVAGTSGNDTMVGADRAYFLNDRLFGDYGNDSLDGGLGHNALAGGYGDDTYHVGHGLDFITDTGGTDQVVFDNTFDPNLITFHFNELMNNYDPTTQGLQIFYDGQLKAVIDQEFAFGSANFVEKVSVDGVHDFDIASMNWDQHGTEGNDSLYVIQTDAIHNSVYGNGGDDVIMGSSHVDDLHGGEGADHIYGSDGNDTLYGDNGDDYLSGDAGDDILHAGDGTDGMSGGAGADTFIFEATTAFHNVDTIYDFNTGQGDKLDIKDLLTGYTPGTSDIADFVTLTETGGSTTVSVDRDGAGSTYSAASVATLYNVTGLDVHDLLTNHNIVAA